MIVTLNELKIQAQNEDVAESVLYALCRSEDHHALWAVAKHPKASSEILDLAHEVNNRLQINSNISSVIASHPNVSVPTLNKMRATKELRRFVLGNPKAPVEWSEEFLKNDGDKHIDNYTLQQILENSWTPDHLLRKAFYVAPPYILQSIIKKRGETLPFDLQYTALYDRAHNGAGGVMVNVFRRNRGVEKKFLIQALLLLNVITVEETAEYEKMPVAWIEQIAELENIPFNKISSHYKEY